MPCISRLGISCVTYLLLVQALGLTAAYREDPVTRRWVQRAMALALVPVDDVDAAYERMDRDAPENANDYHDYLVDTYIAQHALFGR